MGLFGKAKRGLKKVGKKAGRSFAGGAKRTFRKTIGKGAKKTPSGASIGRAVKRSNPFRGIRGTTKALKPKKRKRPSR